MDNIVLILRSGGDFRFQDVNLLISHINKYWGETDKPNIYCYTDSVNKETPLMGVTLRPLPNKQWKGWWSKMNLFHKDLKGLRPFLYLDLDTVVIGSLSPMFLPKEYATHFVALEDFYRKGKTASGVMWIPNTAYTDKIYSEWIKNPAKYANKFRGDQNFIESVKPADVYWQKIFDGEFVTTFKPILNGDKRPTWRTELPVNSTVVCFHGTPRIYKAAQTVDWVNKYVSYAI